MKKAVIDYLQYGQNQGKWFFMRLNAGDFILTDTTGNFRRRVQGVKKGTADLIVIQPASVQTHYKGQAKGEPHSISRVTFLECKSSKGKTTKEQDEFAEEVRRQHCRYFIIRDVDEIVGLLK